MFWAVPHTHTHTHIYTGTHKHTNTRAPTDSYPADRPANRQAFCTRSDSLSWLIACDRGLCHNYPGPYHKLMRCIFHVLAAGSAFTVHAGSQSTKKDWSQTNSHARTHTSSNRAKWVKAGWRAREERKKIKKEGRGRWGRERWGGRKGVEIDSEERKEKGVSLFFFFFFFT